MKAKTNKANVVAILEKQSVADLKKKAKQDKIALTASMKKSDIIQTMAMFYFPEKESETTKKNRVLAKSKVAKKAKTTQGKLAATYEALKTAIETKVELKGIKARMWKNGMGVSISFTEGKMNGFDKAVFCNLIGGVKQAMSEQGVKLNSVTIRKSGSLALYAK